MNKGEFGSYGAIGDSRGFDREPGFGITGGGYGQPGYQGSGTSEISETVEQCTNNIIKINSNSSALEKTLRQIGTSSDTPALRTRIHNTQQATNSIVNKTARFMKDLANMARGATRQQKFQVDRLKSDFESTVKGYSSVQKKVADN
ncbi:t-SNARE domain-containing protein 1-like [Ptychodera flava]|uniref:t-SNARE domain-containing protein 1-like n=1 Tax=Ptychodera flava TaxID=63121 RepID=UPI003969FEA8